MDTRFTIRANQTSNINKLTLHEGSAVAVQFDYGPWAEHNGTITTVTWTVQSGNAAVSGQALASNLASALVTLASSGGSLIKISATNGTETYVAYLDILTTDPYRPSSDYGLCS